MSVGLAVICVILLFFSIFHTALLNKSLSEDIQNFLVDINYRTSHSLEEYFNQTSGLIQSMSKFMGSEENFISEHALRTMDDYIADSDILRMSIALPDGTLHNVSYHDINIRDRDYFRAAMNGHTVVSEIMISRFSGEKQIAIAAPISDDRGSVQGVLVGYLDTEVFSNMFSSSSFDGTSFFYVTNVSGSFVLSLEQVRFSQKQTPAETVYQDVCSENAVVSKGSPVREMLPSQNFQFSEINAGGATWYVCSSPIEINDWRLVSVFSVDKVAGNSQAASQRTVTIVAILCIFFVMTMLIVCLVQINNRKHLFRLAYIDPITGGGNANWFKEQFRSKVPAAASYTYDLVLLNPKKFTLFNDVFGHEAGDLLLRDIYRYIQNMLLQDEIVARIGNDHFCFLIHHATEENIITKLDYFAENFNHFNDNATHRYIVTFSAGIIAIENPRMGFLPAYDRALLASSIPGKTNTKHVQIGFFDDRDRKRLLNEREMESRMADALADGEFVVYFQPKYSLSENRIAGAEALVRWIDPTYGIRSPGEFIPLFEKNGFLLNIDTYIFEQVCRYMHKWIAVGKDPFVISVNLSRTYMDNPVFLGVYSNIVSHYNIPPKFIEFEITETVVYEDTERLINIIQEIHNLGFSCSIDDFGSGYSSLNMLKSIPVDVIKLDKGFFDMTSGVHVGHETERADIVVETIVQLAKRLSMKTVCEGVETQQQLSFLRNLNCDLVQGYVFSKPVPAEKFEEMAFGAVVPEAFIKNPKTER